MLQEILQRPGTLARSEQRSRSSRAMSSVTSRDQRSAVLKATIRSGWEYCPDSKFSIRRSSFGICRLGLAPRHPKPASEIVQHKIDFPVWILGHD
jgi:hypothetical protein